MMFADCGSQETHTLIDGALIKLLNPIFKFLILLRFPKTYSRHSYVKCYIEYNYLIPML